MIAVAGIVLVISMGWRFSGYLNEAASGGITKDVLFLIMLYRLPGFLELILPISFFLSIMLTYGRLYVDSEMVVLESTGMSPLKLISITLTFSSLIMVSTAVISLWLKPAGEAKFEVLFADQRNLTEFDTLAPGRFQSLRSGMRVTYTESLDDDGYMQEVFIAEQADDDDVGELTVVNAKKGNTQVDPAGNRFLVLRDGTRYSGNPGLSDYRIIQFEEYGQIIEKELGNAGPRRRSAISTTDLIADQTPRNLSELHWRISVVIMVPIIALLAVPLSRVNARQGRFTRLLPGMVLCFLYVVSLSTARSALEAGRIPMVMGLWWIHLIYLALIVGIYKFDDLKSLFSARSASDAA
ncbi:MAG: lipopolysaccharide export system permease protein [Candidatus Azotimanducaceae bacterium]|jgi:lipopolysaccharide export system permease protein